MADLRIPEIRDGKDGMLRRRNRDRVLLGMRVIHLVSLEPQYVGWRKEVSQGW